MKKLISITSVILAISLFSCSKEKSFESDGNSNVIIGSNCRISQIACTDSLSGTGIGSTSATINAADTVTSITIFDSLSNTILFNSTPTYNATRDTANINANEYFVLDIATGKVVRLHGLLDPQDPNSPQFDEDFIYDGSSRLVKKSTSFTLNPNTPYEEVTYTYTNNNLTGVTKVNLNTNDLVMDATLDYFTDISPTNYLYLFPDEEAYAPYNQFFNFGTKSINAVKSIKVQYYDPGNVPSFSTLSTFANYSLSLDRYVLSANMSIDDQDAIPATTGKLTFSYKCKL